MTNFYYAVAHGRKPGIYHSWDECRAQVHGFRGPVFKKFKSEQEALEFIQSKSTSPRVRSTAQTKQKFSICPEIEFVGIKTAKPSPPKRQQVNSFSKLATGKYKSPSKRQLNHHHSSPPGVTAAKRPIKTATWKSVKGMPITGKNGEVYPVFHTLWTEYKPHKTTVKNGLEYEEDGSVVVYTDGACIQNGRVNAFGGMGVYWAPNHPDNRSMRLYGRQTNNRAEIQAAVIALNLAADRGYRRITIRTDSKFLVQSATQWLTRWLQNGWELSTGGPVLNESDFRDLIEAMAKLDRVAWQHVNGHRGIRGNEEADRLAREAIGRPRFH